MAWMDAGTGWGVKMRVKIAINTPTLTYSGGNVKIDGQTKNTIAKSKWGGVYL